MRNSRNTRTIRSAIVGICVAALLNHCGSERDRDHAPETNVQADTKAKSARDLYIGDLCAKQCNGRNYESWRSREGGFSPKHQKY
jgi:hypothetical protein